VVAVDIVECYQIQDKKLVNSHFFPSLSLSLSSPHPTLVLEFELRASHLLGRCSTCHAPPPFLALIIFQRGSHIFVQRQSGL
jgi:hypothetical protein